MTELRLFWALNLPDALKAAIAAFQAELKKISPDAKWVEQENLHLTVKFLGKVEEDGVPAVTRAVATAVSEMAPFHLELAGWGTFGRPPRVLWVGVRGDLAGFRELRDRVDAALARLGFAPETKPFSPHLTLARFRSPRNLAVLYRRAETLTAGAVSWGRFRVGRVDLMESILTRRGPVYRTAATVELTGGEGG